MGRYAIALAEAFRRAQDASDSAGGEPGPDQKGHGSTGEAKRPYGSKLTVPEAKTRGAAIRA